MDDKSILEFTDKSVTFDQFVDFLATKVALRIHQIEKGELELTSYLEEPTLKDGLEMASYIQSEFHQVRNGSALLICRS